MQKLFRWYTMVVHTAETGLLQRPYFIGFLSLLRQLAEREGLPPGISGAPHSEALEHHHDLSLSCHPVDVVGRPITPTSEIKPVGSMAGRIVLCNGNSA